MPYVNEADADSELPLLATRDLQKQVETANRRNERVRSLLPPENPKAFHLLNP